jgi:hypothetical protein
MFSKRIVVCLIASAAAVPAIAQEPASPSDQSRPGAGAPHMTLGATASGPAQRTINEPKGT